MYFWFCIYQINRHSDSIFVVVWIYSDFIMNLGEEESQFRFICRKGDEISFFGWFYWKSSKCPRNQRSVLSHIYEVFTNGYQDQLLMLTHKCKQKGVSVHKLFKNDVEVIVKHNDWSIQCGLIEITRHPILISPPRLKRRKIVGDVRPKDIRKVTFISRQFLN